ncbi:NADH dehydrogenase subunit [Halorussus sp. MSC15.2]|uniref:NADH dehydrogenase subunit n=1 Tax=Halorussus sp. MSC15.2 TaxID=2283638 RepID=UPI0013D14FAB|nr:NADH dehydrogenase subunit [Halorussus sp. MSC15.2]NEU58263.1 NADH dehydrogenase subunit [Halorussus sp. MSC15.2]
MSVTLQQLEQAELSDLATTLRNAGVSGAGGAGMPSYAKWDRIDEVDHLLVNHQESEPNYYIDKWLGREHADDFAALFDALVDRAFETVVVGAKAKDRDEWMREFEAATDATVYRPAELPVDPDEESGVVFAYTEDKYEYGMESVLLRMVGGEVIGQDLPMDHGWLVQNTETLYNIFRAFRDGEPTTHKFVHVGGNVPRHRFLEVPIGTPADEVLRAAGRSVSDLDVGELLADGGPGWCFEIENPEGFGVTKRTNCVLVLDGDVVWENTLGSQGRINVISAYNWDGDHETQPTETLRPERVRIPLVTNPAFEGVVAPSEPIVSPGEQVGAGEMIATPGSDGISNTQHASIDGEVERVTSEYVEIRRDSGDDTAPEVRTVAEVDRPLYWTWCRECGEYVSMIDWEGSNPTEYVCHNCR